MEKTKLKINKKSINLLALLMALIMAFLCCPISAASVNEPSESANTFEELPGGVLNSPEEAQTPTIDESELSEEDISAESTASSGSGTNIAGDTFDGSTFY